MKRSSGLPYLVANFALTWDGRISTRTLTPSDFSSKRDKRRLLEIRATGDALLVGKGTLQKENMAMGLPARELREERLKRGQAPYPMRVIVSNSGRIDPELQTFQKTFSPILVYSTARMPKRTQAALSPAATLHLTSEKRVDLSVMLRRLRTEYGVKRVVCEGGAQLLRSLLELDLVDELHTTFCPVLFGGQKAPTLTGLAGDFLNKSIKARISEMEVIGGECFARYLIDKG